MYEEVFAQIGLSNTGTPPQDRLVQTADGNFYGTASNGGVNLGGTVYRITPAGALNVVYAFTSGHTDIGYRPLIGLTRGPDGNLYGLTTQSSGNSVGALFKVTPDGELSVVRYLAPGPFGVRDYRAALIQGSDGAFYGTTFRDSTNPSSTGSVFRLPPTGFTGFDTVLTAATGFNSEASLVEAEDGNFYGTASKGGANGMGTIFRVTPTGSVTAVVSFAGTDGNAPRSALVKASDGNYYGTTSLGGANNFGTIYRFNPATGVTALHSFDGANGKIPIGGLTIGVDGRLYGTTNSGGADNLGAFYRIDLQGQFTFLASFSDEVGVFPQSGVTLGSDGNFYGAAPFGGPYGGTIFRASASGTMTRLAWLGDPEGYSPGHGVIEASDGNFYGSVALGGSDHAGSIFKITPGGTVSTIASLEEATTGRVPTRVLQGQDGNLYGATLFSNFSFGGSVFRLSLQGELTVIAPLTQELGLGASDFLSGSDGNFYGLAMAGGSNNAGTIFRLTPNGDLSTFSSLHVGPRPGESFRFMRDIDGTFYGTASAASGYPLGAAFKVSAAGVDSIFPFQNINQGSSPAGGVTKGNDGNFYGTTRSGGAFGKGTVFRMTPAGVLSAIASFNNPDAGAPRSGLAMADDGSFYGTTFGPGNVLPGGTVFNVTANGTLATVATFGEAGGDRAEGPIIRASDGYFYGTTAEGGIGGGVVLRFTSSPPELHTFGPTSGFSGNAVVLSGKFLAGTSSVKFNGTPASFTIDDSKHITAIVPVGATSGLIEVTNPLGSASTASAFFVEKRSQLLNISTRLRVQTGENVLIGGFIITGTDPKHVIIRGIGPSLSGVGATLPDPTLDLRQGSTTLATNDNWKEHQAEVEATTIPPTNDLESAIVATLAPGTYTAILADKNGASGVGVVEVYDLTTGANSQLANISSRGFVDTGDNVMIGGLIVGGGTGAGSARVLVRALGPSLNNSGIHGALPDTTLELHSENGATIASNDNWKDTQQADIEATTIPPLNNLESAIVSSLAPGNYTAIVRGKGDVTGVGLVEVYNLP